MIRDLRNILDGWDYEPGKISVRRIIGRDGREKIQTRIDLGLLQFEAAGRPDGHRPCECESLLDYHQLRLKEHVARFGSDLKFELSADACRVLRQEAYLYYQRYLALYVLEDFAGVERDTARNLRWIDFNGRYATVEEDRAALEYQRPFVLMMSARARTYRALQRGDLDGALRAVDSGSAAVQAVLATAETPADPNVELELGVLTELRREVLGRLPADAPARLESELRRALAAENYEQAAALRDKLAERRGKEAP